MPIPTPPLAEVRLDDKYALEKGRVFVSGTQALVRLLILQHQRDLKAGLNTAGFVSGYRGSPLGLVDKELWRAAKFLKGHNIVFQPGVNEDLAATAVWGSQQVGLFPGAKYDGVFALWYAKGPGVDRTGDVFKHGNHAGTAPKGGVLLLAGDDPACKSSTVPSQSEYAFMDAQIPVLNPANAQEFLDFGVFGWAMSRYSGCWVAMKTVTENVEGSASVIVDPDRVSIALPNDFAMPPEGLSVRWPDPPLEQEKRLMKHKLYAALAFARTNKIDRVVIDSPAPRFGIITAGKAYLDVMQALDDLGIDEKHAAEIGLRVYKVGMSWPLEREGARHFAEGLEEILVIEEKRAVIENQIKEQLYNWREDVRPRVIGKFDEVGEWILPSAGELTPAHIAKVIAARIDRFYTSPRVRERLAMLEAEEKLLARPRPAMTRIPYFCSGCPHNTSTRVPEGSRAAAGIGCHFMATWMNRSTATFTHMGGEGANWIGQAPFTETPHIFVNIGDGTYFHSGLLAIRAAVSAQVNVTYKILFNDAVAMTGGQPMDGPLDVPTITRQVAAEGVLRIAVVADDVEKYPPGADFAPGVTLHPREDLDAVQRELREAPGVSALVYDQVCAAEKRRRRKRNTFPDPPRRVVINEAVCEGCGDCGVASNCVSVVPLETEFGRKRAIDQSSCNKDYSCVNGFCPSFVSVLDGKLRRRVGVAQAPDVAALPAPALPELGDAPYDVVVTGIGGTGVVTVGAILGMAAHLEGRGVSVLDMTGLAQKNGAVISHLRLAHAPEAIHAARIADGNAKAVIGCDMVTAASADALSKMFTGRTRAVINAHATMTADFTAKPDLEFPDQGLRQAIGDACGGAVDFIDGARIATDLLGDSLATNLFMVGYAWQKGLLPLSEAAILRAIELNEALVDFNRKAFYWGRLAAHDPAAVINIAEPPQAQPDHLRLSSNLDEIISRRVAHLTDYQDAAYAERYRGLVEKTRAAEAAKAKGFVGLSEAVARSYFKLLAIKDEYEVARLMTDPGFHARIAERFEGDYRLAFHLAPPLLAKTDPITGQPRKQTYGGWMLSLFRLLASLKGLRGTWLDVFGRTAERRAERQAIADYEKLVAELLERLAPDNHGLAVELTRLPLTVLGFGHVKTANAQKAKAREAELLAAWRGDAANKSAAE